MVLIHCLFTRKIRRDFWYKYIWAKVRSPSSLGPFEPRSRAENIRDQICIRHFLHRYRGKLVYNGISVKSLQIPLLSWFNFCLVRLPSKQLVACKKKRRLAYCFDGRRTRQKLNQERRGICTDFTLIPLYTNFPRYLCFLYASSIKE